jgi:hypothetical protein
MTMRRFALLLCCAFAHLACAQTTPTADRRGEDQTFLTYPEWFLVYSPDEYAAHLERGGAPSAFPYFGHVGQFWNAYGAIARETGARYAFNGEYHTMIAVIGASTTLEYGLRGAYEKTIGRASELARFGVDTDEDRLQREVARDYVDFIALEPWYKYDFARRLKQVWTDASWLGRAPLRKWERKWALTTEYGAKAIYGWLIAKATHASFDVPIPTTLARVRRASGAEELVTLPRYQPFTRAALALAEGGAEFVEIAGNRGVILVTAQASAGWREPGAWPYRTMFRQKILTAEDRQRVAVVVPVAELSSALRMLSREPFALEHVYDY